MRNAADLAPIDREAQAEGPGGEAGAGGRPWTPRASAPHRVLLLAALLALAVLVPASGALALSGSPVNIGTPYESGAPAVAVSGAGNAVVAWANTKELPPAKGDFIEYCVLPVGSTACIFKGNLIPAEGASQIDNVQVLEDNGTIVILAGVYGSPSLEYEPEQEWASTDGGATFTIVDGGRSVAAGNIAGDTFPLNAVIVPGADALGYAFDSAVDPPTFDEFPSAEPPVCSEKSCPANEKYATLESSKDPDGVTNGGAAFASQTGANPGVLGIFETLFSNGPLGCTGASDFGTAFVYAGGEQGASDNYDKSPGVAGSAWKRETTKADCEVEYAAVAGGPSGFGVVEDDLANSTTVYHAFDQVNEDFDTPFDLIANEFEESPAVSQDGAGGIYVTYAAGFEGELRLAYSDDGGAAWYGPVTLNPQTSLGSPTSKVNAAGQGWAAWTYNGSVYAQPFIASDSFPVPVVATPTTLTTSQTAGTTVAASITVPDGTVGETDRATIAGSNAAKATGTVTYTLYNNPTCTAASKVFSGIGAVAGGAAAASPAVTAVLGQGTYYWQAAYSGDVSNQPSISACGSEVLKVVPAASLEGSGSSTATTVTITITCTVVPCTVTVTITIEGGASKASVSRKKKGKRKNVTIASGTFTIKKAGPNKLTLHLTKAGKQLIRKDHGRLTAALRLSEKEPGGLQLITRTVKFTPAKAKHNKR